MGAYLSQARRLDALRRAWSCVEGPPDLCAFLARLIPVHGRLVGSRLWSWLPREGTFREVTALPPPRLVDTAGTSRLWAVPLGLTLDEVEGGDRAAALRGALMTALIVEEIVILRQTRRIGRVELRAPGLVLPLLDEARAVSYALEVGAFGVAGEGEWLRWEAPETEERQPTGSELYVI